MTIEVLHEGDGWGRPYALLETDTLLVLRANETRCKPYVYRNGQFTAGTARDGQAQIVATSGYRAAIVVNGVQHLYDPASDTLEPTPVDDGLIVAMSPDDAFRVIRLADGSLYLMDMEEVSRILLPPLFDPVAVDRDANVFGRDVARNLPAVVTVGRDDRMTSYLSLSGYVPLGSTGARWVAADGANERVATVPSAGTISFTNVNSINPAIAYVDAGDLIMADVPIKGDAPDARQNSCAVLDIGFDEPCDLNGALGRRPLTHGSRRVLYASGSLNDGSRFAIEYEAGVQVALGLVRP